MKSYGYAVQEAVFTALDAALSGGVYDSPPQPLPDAPYVLVGEATARQARRRPGVTVQELTVEVVSRDAGFAAVKARAAQVADILTAPLPLSVGRMLGLRLIREDARRGRGAEQRRVVMRFEARIATD